MILRSRTGLLVTVLPGLAYLLIFFVAPLAIIVAYSFGRAGPSGGVEAAFTWSNYARALDPVHGSVLLRSARLAGITTLVSLAIGYPVAWAVRTMPRRHQLIALAVLIIPSWMNLLVKNYAWIVLLRRQGVLNTLFESAGLIDAPLPLLFNEGAVLTGLVHTYLPFMVLPLYASLDRMDWSLVEAARDLGAGGWQVFRRIVVPQTMAGAVVGCMLVFIPALGAFVTPDLLGGPTSLMVGTLIENQVLMVRDWPVASALSVLLMLVVGISLVAYRRVAPRTDGVLP